MPGSRYILAFLAFFAAFAAGPLRAQAVNIVYIGDSITYGAGLGDPKTEAPPVIATDWLRAHAPDRQFFFANQGRGGHTTVDTLPATGTDYPQISAAARELVAAHPGALVFTIMLGANDSAIKGPRGAPVTKKAYRKNLAALVDRLLADHPGSLVMLNHPLWYSPNTDNGVGYRAEGLARLTSYLPEVDAVVASHRRSHPGRVFRGDVRGFDFFRRHHLVTFQHENGRLGTFYLHPDRTGAADLGRLWGEALLDVLATVQPEAKP